MYTARADIDLFMRKCDELCASGIILADTRIAELLKCIVASDVLYAVFRKALRGYDHAAACRVCMQGTGARKQILLPKDEAQKAAFIFCLLVDIDGKRLTLNKLLQEYFYADGSLYESYFEFCERIVKPLRSAVYALLQAELSVSPASDLAEAVRCERNDVMQSDMPELLKVDALLLLNELSRRLRGASDGSLAAALCGYLYFCAGCDRKNERTDALRDALVSVKERL